MDPYTPRTLTHAGGRKKNIGLSKKEYTKVCMFFFSLSFFLWLYWCALLECGYADMKQVNKMSLVLPLPQSAYCYASHLTTWLTTDALIFFYLLSDYRDNCFSTP